MTTTCLGAEGLRSWILAACAEPGEQPVGVMGTVPGRASLRAQQSGRTLEKIPGLSHFPSGPGQALLPEALLRVTHSSSNLTFWEVLGEQPRPPSACCSAAQGTQGDREKVACLGSRQGLASRVWGQAAQSLTQLLRPCKVSSGHRKEQGSTVWALSSEARCPVSHPADSRPSPALPGSATPQLSGFSCNTIPCLRAH